jgi:hypothetical protein
MFVESPLNIVFRRFSAVNTTKNFLNNNSSHLFIKNKEGGQNPPTFLDMK